VQAIVGYIGDADFPDESSKYREGAIMSEIGTVFKPGDTVPVSGIYRVTHDPRHTQEHEVTCVKGKRFPPCRDCAHPRFILQRKAHHVETHEFFSHYY